MAKRILLDLIRFYRAWISPAAHGIFPSGCKFDPTCSQYASEAIEMHGAGRGSWMALQRLGRCHPFTSGGFDPVPTPGSREEQAIAPGAPLNNPLP